MTERSFRDGYRKDGAERPCESSFDRASAEPPGYDALAGRIVDLWQDHLAHAAADPALATMLAAAIRAAERMGAAGGNGGDHERTGGEAGGWSDGTTAPGAEAGATAAAASSGVGGADLDEFRRRLAALEERLLAVEQRAGRCAGRGLEHDPEDA